MTDNSREGWIKWAGGENPFPGDETTLVECRFPDGSQDVNEACIWDWNSTRSPIIAYRVVTDADDRRDGYEAPLGVVSKSSPDELAIAVERVTVRLAEIRAADGNTPSRAAMFSPDDIGLILSRLASQEETNTHLRTALARQNEDISQTLGKALGYPWFKDDAINFPGSTEADGVCIGDHVAESIADEAAQRIAAQEETIRADGIAFREIDQGVQITRARHVARARLSARQGDQCEYRDW